VSRDTFVAFGNVGQRAWSPQFALAGLWLGSFLIRLVCASLSRVQRRFCYWLGKTCTTHQVGFLWQNLLYTRDRDAQTRFSKKNKNGGLDFFEKPCLCIPISCVEQVLPLVGLWLGSGWALAGLWLGSGWALAGLWLGSGWALAGLWPGSGWALAGLFFDTACLCTPISCVMQVLLLVGKNLHYTRDRVFVAKPALHTR
jgi:hypothetical protein